MHWEQVACLARAHEIFVYADIPLGGRTMAEAGSLGGMPESFKYAATELVVQGAASEVKMVVYPAEVEGGCVVGGGRRRPMWFQRPVSAPCNESLGDASASVERGNGEATISVVVE